MKDQIENLRLKLVDQIKEMNNSVWQDVRIEFQFPPTSDKYYKTIPAFRDENGKILVLFLKPNPDFQDALYKLIYGLNKEGDVNQIIFTAKSNEIENGAINVLFDKTINDVFENNLPKKMRGKTTGWYKI
ncbi:MAG: hypothetical protein ABI402_05880 [Ferruginibacter sp.]